MAAVGEAGADRFRPHFLAIEWDDRVDAWQQLARRMLERAFAAGVPAAWVTGDAVYGGDRRLRLWLEEREQPFVLEIAFKEPLWAGTSAGPAQVRADQLAVAFPADAWERLSAGWGAKGPRLYDWARLPLARWPWPGFEHWLLVRHSLGQPEELADYVVFAPAGTALPELVWVAGSRWAIEECLERAKGDVGLDQYEVRRWDAWYRFITLALVAHAYLTVLRARALLTAEKGDEAAPPPLAVALPEELLPVTVPEVRRLLRGMVWQSAPPADVILRWSWWRRRHQQRAKRCHYQKRLARHGIEVRL